MISRKRDGSPLHPEDQDAYFEHLFIGAILRHPEFLEYIPDKVRRANVLNLFYWKKNREIFNLMFDRYSTGRSIDLPSLCDDYQGRVFAARLIHQDYSESVGLSRDQFADYLLTCVESDGPHTLAHVFNLLQTLHEINAMRDGALEK